MSAFPFIVGMRAKFFWKKANWLRPRLHERRTLDVAQQLLLFRLKLRQNFTYRLLAILFKIGCETTRLIFWDVCCANYTFSMQEASNWCRHDLSDEWKSRMFAKMQAKDNLLARTLAKFKDPSDLNRIPYGISVDSTRLKVQKSSFVPLQKSTYYVEYNTNVLVLTNASTLDGKIILHSAISPGISPSAGDSRTFGFMLNQDEMAMEEQRYLPNGFGQLINGSKTHFCVVFVGMYVSSRYMPST